jgi:hypothetical protein
VETVFAAIHGYEQQDMNVELGSAFGAFSTKISKNVPVNLAISASQSDRNSRIAERIFIKFSV